MRSPPPRRRVLIIDDNVALAENIAEILEMNGFLTQVAANGHDALAKAPPGELDIVVTDYRLPDTTGANLVRQLKTMHLRVHAIVISAYTDQNTIDDANNAGATFIAKPINLALLGDALQAASTAGDE